MKDKVVVASPNAGVFVRKTVNAYEQAGILYKYFTALFYHRSSTAHQILDKLHLFSSLRKRRDISELPLERVEGLFLPEFVRTIAARLLGARVTHQIWEKSEWMFDQWVANKLSAKVSILHVYEHAALFSIRRARALKIFTVYEQPSQHYTFFNEQLLQQQLSFPELKNSSYQLLNAQSLVKVNQRKDEELLLADMVLCNSTFTKSTLVKAGIDAKKIVIVPLGFPAVATHAPKPSDQIEILFAGTIGLRKGAHLLLKVWHDYFKDNQRLRLRLLGKMELPEDLVPKHMSNVEILQDVPHYEMTGHYRRSQVLILPSLADGFGMVITEAMAQGLVVIASENSGGPDIINHEENGFIIKAGDQLAIKAAIDKVLEVSDSLSEIGKNAIEKARSWQWVDYQRVMVQSVLEFRSNQHNHS